MPEEDNAENTVLVSPVRAGGWDPGKGLDLLFSLPSWRESREVFSFSLEELRSIGLVVSQAWVNFLVAFNI